MQQFIIEIAHRIFFLIPLLLLSFSSINGENIPESRFESDWIIFSSEKTNSTGKEISAPGFKVSESFRTDIPKTVFAALVENGVYKNPLYGENLLNISKEPFQVPWWYRKEFDINEVTGE